MASLGRQLGMLFAALAAFQLFAVAQAPSTPPPHFAIVLDAGHGGADTGASITTQSATGQPQPTGSGTTEPEKQYTLALSVHLRSLLGARGMTVVTTRETDVALDPSRRAEIANHAAAQACISLHAAMNGTGVHLFISSLSPSEPTQLAPWKTAQAAWVPRSLALAGVLNSALQQAGITVTVGRTALTAIDSMACPAVAVEVAPESGSDKNSDNGSTGIVDDPAYQAKIADALAAALLEWRSEGAHLGGQTP